MKLVTKLTRCAGDKNIGFAKPTEGIRDTRQEHDGV